jgi:hypothetical protein
MKVFIAETAYIQPGIDVPATLARELRRAEGFISLAVQAGYAVLGKELSTIPRSGSHGLILGTAFGPMQTNFDVLDQVVLQEHTSPTLFSHSVFNAAAGYLSRIFRLQGSALTVTDFAFPFFQALQQGSMAVASGRLDTCLVLQVETYSDLLADARARIIGKDIARWPVGAVAWLLSRDNGKHGKEISAIDVRLQPSAGSNYIMIDERLTCNTQDLTVADPLGSAVAVTGFIAETLKEEQTFRISASYGHIELCCNPSSPEREK